jgi:carbon storage regulator CsrA
MLVLTRKNRESVVIGQPGEMRIALEITILEIEGGRVRIGFEADTKLPIHRREVWDRICNGHGNGQAGGNGQVSGNGQAGGNGKADGNGQADGQPLAAALARMEGRRQAGG